MSVKISRAAKRGGFKRGVFPIWTFPSFFVLFLSVSCPFVVLFCPFLSLFCPFLSVFVRFFGTFPIFPGFSRFARGWSRDLPDLSFFLFLGLLREPTRNSPERVRDTIWTFPENFKSGKPPGLETPRFSFSQKFLRFCLV